MKKDYLEGCRPFLGLDGCHLKGPYDGILLFAVSIDGNEGLFSMAYGVVEIECKNRWRFFFQYLYLCIGGVTVDNTLIIIFDKQKVCTFSYYMLKFLLIFVALMH